MKRALLVLLAACESGGGDTPQPRNVASCVELQDAVTMEIGECTTESEPIYADGCPFVLGGLCQPTGLMADCDPAFADMAGVGCDLDGTNCHYDLPHCSPRSAELVTYGVRVVYEGVAGLIVFDIDADKCQFRPCL